MDEGVSKFSETMLKKIGNPTVMRANFVKPLVKTPLVKT